MPPRSKKPGFTEAERQAAVARVDRGEDIDWSPPKDNSPAEKGCATRSYQKRDWPSDASEVRADYTIKTKQRLLDTFGPFCTRCGETDLSVLQFDHIAPAGRTGMVRGSLSGQTGLGGRLRAGRDNPFNIQVLCANCHARKTADERSHYWRVKSPPVGMMTKSLSEQLAAADALVAELRAENARALENIRAMAQDTNVLIRERDVANARVRELEGELSGLRKTIGSFLIDGEEYDITWTQAVQGPDFRWVLVRRRVLGEGKA